MHAIHVGGEVVYLANDVEVEIARLRGKIGRQRAHLRGASAEGRRKNKALRSMNKTISRLQKRIAELETRLAAADKQRQESDKKLTNQRHEINWLKEQQQALKNNLAAAEADRDYWMKDSAAAWDKCEERRLQAVAAEAGEDALAECLRRLLEGNSYWGPCKDLLAAYRARRG